ncbi:carbonic anhydrase [Methanothermococcus sp. SCGC AD-155-K20]|nr:carbonic anhydrase [Methanothermococcus sp. SCGC AD-155-K20]
MKGILAIVLGLCLTIPMVSLSGCIETNNTRTEENAQNTSETTQTGSDVVKVDGKDMDTLIKNYMEYRNDYYEKNKELFRKLSEEGQKPKVLFITCSDSRVVPSIITKSDPGDLFVLRNIGNFVPPHESVLNYSSTASAIEYAVSVLKVEHIIVCGHSQCGACAALYDDIPDTPEMMGVNTWLKVAEPVKEHALKEVGKEDKEKLAEFTEKTSIKFQIENLMTYPGVKKRVESGDLPIHGWYFKIESGEVEYYNKNKDDFVPLDKFHQE